MLTNHYGNDDNDEDSDIFHLGLFHLSLAGKIDNPMSAVSNVSYDGLDEKSHN